MEFINNTVDFVNVCATYFDVNPAFVWMVLIGIVIKVIFD